MVREREGSDIFYLDDCSSPVEALEAAMGILEEVCEKEPTKQQYMAAVGPVCYGLCNQMDNMAEEALDRYVNNQPIDSSFRLFEELEKVKPVELTECIRNKWIPFFNVKELFGVMTCPEDKVDDYEEELKEVGFTVRRVSFSELLQSGFDGNAEPSTKRVRVTEFLRKGSETISPVCWKLLWNLDTRHV